MEAVRDGVPFGLRSPKTHEVVKTVDARSLSQKILDVRLQTGEPYLIFEGTVNRLMPQHQRELGLKVRQSNLCSEIMLHTGPDHLGIERTAVCCLSSVNAETFMEGATTRPSSRTCCASWTMCCRTSSTARRRPWRRPATPPCASGRWASA